MGTLKEIKQNSYIRLEEFIETEKLTSVDFIKLDVDGHELDVLKSGEKSLAKIKPVIFITSWFNKLTDKILDKAVGIINAAKTPRIVNISFIAAM